MDFLKGIVAYTYGTYHAIIGYAKGAANGNAVTGSYEGSGSGAAVYGAYSGSGSGHAIVGNYASSGNGNGVYGQKTGAGTGYGVSGLSDTSGAAGGIGGQVNGPGNGHAVVGIVGSTTTATGTGYALVGLAYNVPGNNSHGAAVYGYQAVATNWSGYFDGQVGATAGFVNSDMRIKTDIQPMSDAEALALYNLPIKSFYKHVNSKASLFADAIRNGDDTGAIDLTPTPGARLDCRFIGIIAQDVEAINPSYVCEAQGVLSVSEATVLFGIIHSMKKQIEDLRTEINALKAA